MYEQVAYDPTGALSSIMLIFGLILVMLIIFEPSKTKKYRRTVVDLYVAGKVRELAKNENIDLEVELEKFRNWKKKQRMENQSLDDTIESESQDKITDKSKTSK